MLAIAPGSTRASFVYGANDSRLMDRYKNIYQVESAKDQSYIRLELDVSARGRIAERQGEAARLPRRLQGHRRPLAAAEDVRDRRRGVINAANKHAEHTIEFRSAFGQITLTIDGSTTFAGTAVRRRLAAPGGPGGQAGRRRRRAAGAGARRTRST